MKKTFAAIVVVMVAVLLCAVGFSACELARKVTGAEVNFPKKVAAAQEFSFDMHLTIQSGSETSDLEVGCYKKGAEYAYVFADPSNANVRYRKLFADNRLYEFVTRSPVGSYYVHEGVSYTSEDNFLYAITENIMLASYASLLTKAQKETLDGRTVYRYDFEKSGNAYTLWYDDENLVKIRATFRGTDGSGNETSETYTASFKNYLFANIDKDPFLRPSESTDALYVESPISFEQWMSILDRFSVRAAHWLG